MRKDKKQSALSIACMALALFATGCTHTSNVKQSIEEAEVKILAPLIENDPNSPSCNFTANIQYIKTEDTDTIGMQINKKMIALSLGQEYQTLSAPEAIDLFKNEYIANYRKEISDFYKEDLKNAEDKSAIPSWYNFEFMLTTQLKEGKEGIFNYISTIMEYRGGAHPNQWSKWVNIRKADGEILSLNDIFVPTYKSGVNALILEALIKEMATRLNDSSIKTLKDLQENNILDYSELYVPDNFLLEKEGISFLYNQYDIAPYSMGVIVISLPYSQLKPYLNY